MHMFDTNAFNDILDGRIDIGRVRALGQLEVTHVQHNELRATPDPERRKQLLDVLVEVGVETVNSQWDLRHLSLRPC